MSPPAPESGPRFLLVTGTDTGVGKTVVATALAAMLTRAGRRVLAVKPVESGCAADEAAPEEDGPRLAASTGQRAPRAALVRLRAPLAPPLAAEREGGTLRPEEWEAELRRLAAGHELVVVEGAGGLLSPLAWGYDARRLALALGAAALVVGVDRLGTMSHCSLVLEALANARIPVLGVVLSAPSLADESTGSNAAALTRCGLEHVVTLPRLDEPDHAEHHLGEVAARVGRWLDPTAAEQSDDDAPDTGWDNWLRAELSSRQRRHLLRELHPLASTSPVRGRLLGRPVVVFAGNDYLGLSSHPAVRDAAAAAAAAHGMGPRAAPLVCGYGEEHAALETELAALAGAETALLFASGWAANTGWLAALAGPDLAIFSDQWNHASIIDGCRLAARRGAEVRVYRHADVGHLEELLLRCRQRRKLLVTDGVFSMDGDLAPLPALVELKQRHAALLAVDEAHGTLVLGERGAGAAEALGVRGEVDLHVGTLSKAVGALGGFIACSATLRTFLLNASRPFVYSTALPLPMVAAARAALAVRRAQPELVECLFAHVRRLAPLLAAPAATPILPLRLGAEQAALTAAERLRERGFWVPAIRPPTVPPGTARLRVTVSAAHETEEVERFAAALEALGLAAIGSTGAAD